MPIGARDDQILLAWSTEPVIYYCVFVISCVVLSFIRNKWHRKVKL